VSNGCKTIFYLDPNKIRDDKLGCGVSPASDILKAASESWFVHSPGYSDSGHRVHGVDVDGCAKWLMNPNSSGYQAWWRSYLRANGDGYDIYFMDDDYMTLVRETAFASGGGCYPWPTTCSATHEIADDAHEVQAHANFVNAMTHSNGSPMNFVFQQASWNNTIDQSAFTTTSHIVGMTCEGCVSTWAYPSFTLLHPRVLDAMAAVHQVGGMFWLISHGNSPVGATQFLQRKLTTGFVWLGYTEGLTAVWPDLETNNNNLPIWPEDLIYPSHPLQSMTTGHTDLEVASGVYRREFTTCYQKGVYFGVCAAVVNDNSTALPVVSSWLRQTYHHYVWLTGGDELHGGIANRSGGSFVVNSTKVDAGGAILLTP
jgi:hypothetical protein